MLLLLLLLLLLCGCRESSPILSLLSKLLTSQIEFLWWRIWAFTYLSKKNVSLSSMMASCMSDAIFPSALNFTSSYTCVGTPCIWSPSTISD